MLMTHFAQLSATWQTLCIQDEIPASKNNSYANGFVIVIDSL
ncbi:Uncharacterised protein [Budvicia aquatica]|uniref:Uncharacterized protein n=1 Tax=Budvicia aquatica TaxID=82979 RepID=A0A484ZXB7_9GAMM|nr:Uncharacterised protein [Budvicia aquatica]